MSQFFTSGGQIIGASASASVLPMNMGRIDIEYSILKSRDITLPKMIHLVNAMVFPVVMYRCES